MSEEISLINGELGSLNQIADTLWAYMQMEIKRYGRSDVTLALEGAVYGIQDIIKLNNLKS